MESSIVQPGSLGGVNPSEDLDVELAALSGQADEPVDAPEAAGEPVTPVEERDTPDPDPEPAAKKPSSPARIYLVLQREQFEDASEYFVIIGEVESRNAQNALRKAARELRPQLGETATLLVVPKTVWRPTPVTLTVDERVSVSIG